MKKTIVPVPSHVHAVIWRLIDGWRPAPFKPARLTSLQLGDRDFSERVGETNIKIPEIEVAVENLMFENTDSLWNVPLKGRFGDGSVLVGECACPSGSGAQSRYWTIANETHRARLWLGAIHGKLPAKAEWNFNGNLTTSEVVFGADGSPHLARHVGDHLRLEGRHTYYLIRTSEKPEWFLIVETCDGLPPRREDLYPDFLALQFVLGRGLKFRAFSGIDDAGETVGMVGGEYGRDQGEDAKVAPPVPLSKPTLPFWPAPFFRAISKAYADKQLRLYIPLSGYVESMAEAHVEGRSLRLHVALEAFANWFLEAKSKTAKDASEALAADWERWVTAHEQQIRAIACAHTLGDDDDKETAADVLLSKVRSACLSSLSQSVPAAFAHHNVRLPQKMKRDLAKVRGKLVHRAILFAEPQKDVETYLAPIAVVRTLLVGLLAKVVGYQGEILGWEKEKGRDYIAAPSSWWPTSNDCHAEAMVMYTADIGDVDALRTAAARLLPGVVTVEGELAEGGARFPERSRRASPGPVGGE